MLFFLPEKQIYTCLVLSREHNSICQHVYHIESVFPSKKNVVLLQECVIDRPSEVLWKCHTSDRKQKEALLFCKPRFAFIGWFLYFRCIFIGKIAFSALVLYLLIFDFNFYCFYLVYLSVNEGSCANLGVTNDARKFAVK